MRALYMWNVRMEASLESPVSACYITRTHHFPRSSGVSRTAGRESLEENLSAAQAEEKDDPRLQEENEIAEREGRAEQAKGEGEKARLVGVIDG